MDDVNWQNQKINKCLIKNVNMPLNAQTIDLIDLFYSCF